MVCWWFAGDFWLDSQGEFHSLLGRVVVVFREGPEQQIPGLRSNMRNTRMKMICLSVPVATWKSWEQISISRSLVGKPHTRSCLGQIFVAMTCPWSTWCSIGKGGIYTELQRFHWISRSVTPNRTSTHCCWNPTTRTRSTLICEKSRLAVCMSFGTFPKLPSTTPRIGNPKVGSRRDESLIRKSKSQWLAEACFGMFLVSVPRLFCMISRHSCTWISLEMPG